MKKIISIVILFLFCFGCFAQTKEFQNRNYFERHSTGEYLCPRTATEYDIYNIFKKASKEEKLYTFTPKVWLKRLPYEALKDFNFYIITENTITLTKNNIVCAGFCWKHRNQFNSCKVIIITYNKTEWILPEFYGRNSKRKIHTNQCRKHYAGGGCEEYEEMTKSLHIDGVISDLKLTITDKILIHELAHALVASDSYTSYSQGAELDHNEEWKEAVKFIIFNCLKPEIDTFWYARNKEEWNNEALEQLARTITDDYNF